ncbi:hypothetical protein [Gordonia sp. OPL2]|uniref:hypothetical protein n=1 Tax=Gordonia sp. OPL2 TaxID=2486274 RepID=UPI0016550A43|nr:hypothetical protein [Gordonia sp. OPL2]
MSEHPTQPIVPSVTEEIRRWPAGDPGTPIVEYHASEVVSGAVVSGAVAPDAAVMTPQSQRFSVQPPVPASITRRDIEDRPIPAAVPEIWEYTGPVTSPRLPPVAAPITAGSMPMMSPRPRESSAMVATAALVTSVVSLPLALVGVGAVLGLIAMIVGVTALVQIGVSRNAVVGSTRHRGTGRAITSLVLATGSIVVGAPILLVILAIAAIL